ncbi:restriction endonuclease subunit S [Vibrio kanaloae]|uniref:restriction endonuclease subunit S n=1 Tax=Vibrio kanaloae TaxID=170673 RepID=UPI000988F7A1|nr:restriction endonuclease subunit S [Vibrio kanaloae]QPK05200.1 restriction endonuclease subunit S [Vibrio kanaloae]
MESLALMPKYEAYKNSGVEWLGAIPVHWNSFPLCAKSKLKSISNNENEELLSVYLDKGVIKFDDVDAKRTNATSSDLTKYQLVEPGDFVLNNQQAWRGSVGVSDYRGIVSPAYLVLSLSEDIVPRFGNYLFRDGAMVANYLVSSKGVGTIQRNLYWPQLKRALVFLPPTEEQLLIACFLDKKTAQIDDAIAIKEQQINLLKERKQIIIQQAVTQGLEPNVPMKDSGVDWIGEIPEHWDVVKLKLLTNKIVDGAHFTPTYVDKGVPFLRVTDLSKMKDGVINWETVRYIPIKEHKELIKRAKADKGDVLLSKNGTIGLTKVIDWEIEFSFFVSLCLIKLKPQLNPNYFTSFFNSPIVDKQISFGSSRTSVTNLHLEKIKELLIILPPLNEQDEVMHFINQIDAKYDPAIDVQVQQIEKLKEYKTTLINSAVTGKIKITPEMVEQ